MLSPPAEALPAMEFVKSHVLYPMPGRLGSIGMRSAKLTSSPSGSLDEPEGM